jgi:GAF domain-containing protein
VPVESLKLGLFVCNCVKTKKPAITNDVINDPRIRYPEWARKEKLKSYAGYPLLLLTILHHAESHTQL